MRRHEGDAFLDGRMAAREAKRIRDESREGCFRTRIRVTYGLPMAMLIRKGYF